MALDTSGVYSEGDDYRVIKVLNLPFGSYTLDCVASCLNQLEDMSVPAATDLVALLDAWDAADDAQSTQDLADVEGKVLVKADVLSWEVVNGGMSGPAKEKSKVEDDVRQIMSFCTCLGGYLGMNYYGSTPLMRS